MPGNPTRKLRTRLNEQVKRNIKRFPEDFMFQLTDAESSFSRSQSVTLTNLLPMAY
ncbi:MAG: ORF6N domain-containing protein [Leptospirales bacterium]